MTDTEKVHPLDQNKGSAALATRPKRLGKSHMDVPLDRGDVDPLHSALVGYKHDERTAESAAVREHAARIKAAYRRTVEATIETGKLLIAAKAAVGHGKWGELLRYLPFGERQAEMLMRIAEHPVLSDPQYIADLPSSWATLYELSGVKPDEVTRLISERKITPATTRKDAKELCTSQTYPANQEAAVMLYRLHLLSTYRTPQSLAGWEGWASLTKNTPSELRQLTHWINGYADELERKYPNLTFKDNWSDG